MSGVVPSLNERPGEGRQYQIVSRVPMYERGMRYVGGSTSLIYDSWDEVIEHLRGSLKLQREGHLKKEAVFQVRTRSHGPAPWEDRRS